MTMATFGQNWMAPVNQFGGIGQSEWDKLYGQGGLFETVEGTKNFLAKSDSERWDQYRDRLASTVLGQLGGVYMDPEARQRFGQNLESLQSLANLQRMRDPGFASNPTAGAGNQRSNLEHYLQPYLQGGDLAKATGFGGDFNSVFADVQRGAAGATTQAAKDAYTKYARSGLEELAARQMGGAPGAAAQGMLGGIFGGGTNPGATWWQKAAESPYAGMFGFANGVPPTTLPTPTPPTIPTGVVGNTGGGITPTSPTIPQIPPPGRGFDGVSPLRPAMPATPTTQPQAPTNDPVVTADTVLAANPFEGNWGQDDVIEALNDFAGGAGRPPTMSELLQYLQTYYLDRRKVGGVGYRPGVGGLGNISPTLGVGMGVRA